MLRTALLYVLAAIFLCLGLLGLLVPVLPGFLFLIVAALCASAASPTAQRTLQRQPRSARVCSRPAMGTQLSTLDRARLSFWLTARNLLDALRGR